MTIQVPVWVVMIFCGLFLVKWGLNIWESHLKRDIAKIVAGKAPEDARLSLVPGKEKGT